MNDTFSIVHYDDGTVEIVAGEVAVADGNDYKITNDFVLEYLEANKVGVRFIESGITHMRVDIKPQFDIHAWNTVKHIEVGEDQISNNYTEE